MASVRVLALALALVVGPFQAAAQSCGSYSSCSSCDAYGCTWCGTSTTYGYCSSYGSSCSYPYSSYYTCSSSGGGGSSASSQLTGINSVAQAQGSGGIAGSVIVAILVASLWALFIIYRAGAGTGALGNPAAAKYTAASTKNWKLLLAAFSLQTFGLLVGIAAVAIPWFSGGVSGSFTASGATTSEYVYIIANAVTLQVSLCMTSTVSISSCSVISEPNYIMVFGGALYLIALILFVFPAWILAARATLAVFRVATFGVMPLVAGCCQPGVTVILGLTWFAFVLQVIAGAILWVTIALLEDVLVAVGSSTANYIGPGAALLGVALISSFISNICYSVVGCCGIGDLPGIGRSPRNCCCTNQEVDQGANQQPGGLQPNPMAFGGPNPLSANKPGVMFVQQQQWQPQPQVFVVGGQQQPQPQQA